MDRYSGDQKTLDRKIMRLETLGNIKIPRHLGIIMDGNGRWAQMRGLPRLAGHQEGVKAVERIIKASSKLKIQYLSLYAFSTENWKRPKTEIEGLMGLFKYYLKTKVSELKQNRVKLLFSGRINGLPEELAREIKRAEESTAGCRDINVIICVNYGGRQEITDSVNNILRTGHVVSITEEQISNGLYNPGVPDPDLIIRTSGETRLSNFLLWESAYSEFYFSNTLWPDFNEDELHKALEYYSGRERRYGSVKDA